MLYCSNTGEFVENCCAMVARESFGFPFKFHQTKGDRMNQVTHSTKVTKIPII